ncbi:SpoIIE family protein phosphatase [Desulfonatronum parangueonense]
MNDMPLAPPNPEPTAVADAPDASRVTVLFVDDEQEILDSLRRNLIREPYRKRFALSAAQGLQILDDEPVHVVVSDIQMPEMDGFAFLREVRKRRPDIVRMVLSGTGNLDQVVNLINTGEIYRYVTKPVHNVKELRTILLQAVELHQIKSQRWELMRELEQRNQELRQWQTKIQHELTLAGAMQRKIFNLNPFLHDRLEISAAYEPHISVGGDFFDVIDLPGNRVCLFIGDVAGHGVAPAMISVLLKVLVEETVRSMFDRGPATICNAIHQRFQQYVQNPESYATMFLAMYDPDASTWRCMNCGHPPPLLLGAPAGIVLDKGGFPVGMSVAAGNICSPEDEIGIPADPGIGILLYTDGLSEAHPKGRDILCDGSGLESHAAMVFSPAVLNPARALLDRVQAQGCDISQDDCSILFVQMTDPASLIWSGSLQQDRRVVEDVAREVQELLMGRGEAEHGAWAVRMAVHEYGMNIIDHARMSPEVQFQLHVRCQGNVCRILFRDTGMEWDYQARKAMLAHRPLDSERGRGLELLAHLSREILFFRRGTINHALFIVALNEEMAVDKDLVRAEEQ